MNLLENAVRYNRENGNVLIKLEVIGEKVRTTVADTGVGISNKDSEKIFTRFYRGDAGSKTGAEGSGIGLSMVCEILELHNSQLMLSSELGQGSSFSFELDVYRSREN